MTDDASEWVTIKVPKADREQAKDYRPDGATYGDCLVAGAERLNDSLDSDPTGWIEGDVEFESFYPDADEIADAVTASLDLDTDHDFDDLAREVAARIDYAMLASKVAEEVMEEMR